jgi:hypothetical protein
MTPNEADIASASYAEGRRDERAQLQPMLEALAKQLEDEIPNSLMPGGATIEIKRIVAELRRLSSHLIKSVEEPTAEDYETDLRRRGFRPAEEVLAELEKQAKANEEVIRADERAKIADKETRLRKALEAYMKADSSDRLTTPESEESAEYKRAKVALDAIDDVHSSESAAEEPRKIENVLHDLDIEINDEKPGDYQDGYRDGCRHAKLLIEGEISREPTEPLNYCAVPQLPMVNRDHPAGQTECCCKEHTLGMHLCRYCPIHGDEKPPAPPEAARRWRCQGCGEIISFIVLIPIANEDGRSSQYVHKSDGGWCGPVVEDSWSAGDK